MVVLCIGDRIRFGDCEVPLQHITAVFGRRSRARLEARHFPPRHSQVPVGLRAGMKDTARDMHKPRRNPATGKIEDERPE